VTPQRRRDDPDFYGYIPDAASKRTLIFFCLFLKGALLLLVRSVSTALVASLGAWYVAAYYAADMTLYAVYKALRRDMWHWVPLEGVPSVVETIAERSIVKILVDFTGVVQFRGPPEMGGAYWVFDMVMALTASFLATYVYVETATDPVASVWTTVLTLSSSWVVFFAIFLLTMRKRYWATFFSLQTGYAWVQSSFVDGKTDVQKSYIHGYNKKLWLSIRPDVKAWTVENWERWEEEQPDWFNDAFKRKVDDDMIPPDSLRRMNGGGGERRRSSLGDVVGFDAPSARRPTAAQIAPVS
jgi:hypothetical protein